MDQLRLDSVQSKVSGSGAGLQRVGMGFATFVSGSMVAGLGMAAKYAGQLESIETGLTTLKSASAAKAMIAHLREFAKKTSFSFMGTAEGAQRILVMGFAAKEVIPALTAQEDAVAAQGGGTEQMQHAYY